jgi:hypothetical protein
VFSSGALARCPGGVELKVMCSFSLLLRLVFWLSVFAFVVGVALGGTPGIAPPDRVAPVVTIHGEEAS